MKLEGKGNIICIKCGKKNPRKDFQRGSKEYKSCNDCAFKSVRVIDFGFKIAFELFEKGVEGRK